MRALVLTKVPATEAARLAPICGLHASIMLLLCAPASFEFPGASYPVLLPSATPIDETFLGHVASHTQAEYLEWGAEGTGDAIKALFQKFPEHSAIDWTNDDFPDLCA